MPTIEQSGDSFGWDKNVFTADREERKRYDPWYMIVFMTAYQAPKEMKYEMDLSAWQ